MRFLSAVGWFPINIMSKKLSWCRSTTIAALPEEKNNAGRKATLTTKVSNVSRCTSSECDMTCVVSHRDSNFEVLSQYALKTSAERMGRVVSDNCTSRDSCLSGVTVSSSAFRRSSQKRIRGGQKATRGIGVHAKMAHRKRCQPAILVGKNKHKSRIFGTL